MQDLEQLGRQLQKSGKADAVKKLAETPEGKRLGAMLDGKAVEAAAKKGDTAALQGIWQQVLATGEGRALAAQLQELMGK